MKLKKNFFYVIQLIIGTVTDVKFWGKHHLFTCSEDGTMAVIKSGKWECLRTFRGHKLVVV